MLKIVLKSFLILLLISAGFFCVLIKFSNAANFGEVVINEIAWMGTTASVNDEWLELKNTTSRDINLNGWNLVAQDGTLLINLSGTISSAGYFLLERTDDTSAPDINADIIYVGALSNNGEFLGLRDQEQTLIDSVDANNGWQGGDNTTKKTMERKDNGAWQTSQNVGGTPRTVNSIAFASSSQELTPTDTRETTPTSTVIIQTTYTFGDVLINEFVSDPADNEVEWVELYNKTDMKIDLTGWWIEEGSKSKTKLEGIIGVNGPDRYKVIEKPAGNLNNDGDIIILYDLGGKIIDQAAYGDWDDGDKSNNAPVARDPFSVARKFDGYNTYNNLNDFSVTIKPTKNASNIIQAEDEVRMEAKAKFDFSNDVFISEILPNPVGDDTKLEFIEIYNAGSRDVNLTGWSLSNKDNKKINFEKIATSAMIKAGEYLSFFRPLTKIVLHNDQGQIKLFQPLADKPIQTVKYKNVKEGWSYNLNKNPSTPLYQGGEKEWGWSETPTQGAMNVFKIINHAPEVDFNMPKEVLIKTPVIFDSSDTDDQDGDSLKFNWDFGDGFKNNLVNTEHTYLKIGIYKVKLEVSDGKDKAEKIKSVKVVGSVDELSMNEQTPLPPLSGGGNSNHCQRR
ncbi:lamin tail domain-containing protein [Patescibacteria group bacterium]|nr:lamin tail domain-containing protein [Patescibacteria group bacterium]MBU1870590.1 lamin tail domain-containing protein [Patescibacteria group bacterium]